VKNARDKALSGAEKMSVASGLELALTQLLASVIESSPTPATVRWLWMLISARR